MNKNHYRIIFSKSKNMFIAVAENVKNKTKSAGQSTGQTTIIKSSHTDDAQFFQNNWIVKSLVASLSFWIALSPVYANIQVDPSANAANRPVIGVGKNQQGQNVPVINIQTPNNGVSHNKYKQMDVLANGAVINNSRNGAQSSLVGQVTANPFLAKGEARIILNEVNSNVATRFEGNLEVAGQRADIIIANPSGINIKGGGFINVNKATFTTGEPRFNADGSIEKISVETGKITVDATKNNLGLGGNNNNAEYVDIYTKALELNAEVYANQQISFISDTHDVSQKDNSYIEGFDLDVKSLGGMYANSIYIAVRDVGLGVRNAGTVQALQKLVIDSNGRVENIGKFETTNAQDSQLSIRTGDVSGSDLVSKGKILSNGNIFLESGQDINLDQAQLENRGKDNQGIISISAKGDINLNNSTNVQNFTDNGDLYIGARNINVGNGVIVDTNGALVLNAQQNLKIDTAKRISGLDDTNLYAGDLLSLNKTEFISQKENLKFITRNAGSKIILDSAKFNSGKDINIYGAGSVSINNLGLSKNGEQSKTKNINVNAQDNLTWKHTSALLPILSGKLDLRSNNMLDITGIQFIANEGINLVGSELNVNTQLKSNKGIDLTASEKDINLNLGTDLSAVSDVNVTALKGNINATNLKGRSDAGHVALMSYKNVNLKANSDKPDAFDLTQIDAKKGITVASIGDGEVTINSAKLNSTDGGIKVQSEKGSLLEDTQLNAKGNIELFTKEHLVLNGVTSTSKQHTALNSKNNIYINSGIGEKDTPVFTSAKETKLTSDGILSVISENNQNIQNVKLTGGAILIEAGGAFNTSKKVELNATGNALLKNDKKLKDLDGHLSIQTDDALTLDPKIHDFKAQGDIELISKKGALTLVGYGGTEGNGSEQVLKLKTANGGIRLEGTKVNIQGSDLTAEKDINIISIKDDLTIDGVKNTLSKIKSEENINKYNNLNKYFDELAKDLVETHKAYLIHIFLLALSQKDNDKYNELLSGVNNNLEQYNLISPIKPYYEYTEEDWSLLKRDIEFMATTNEKYKAELTRIHSFLEFFNNNLVSGYEHKGTDLKSTSGNINITSVKGLSISGSNIEATTGTVNLEAQGVLKDQYVSSIIKDGANTPHTMSVSLIVDGHTNFYDNGNENAENYRMQTIINPTLIKGNKGVNIRAVGTTGNDNLVLQGVGVISENGDVVIEANKSILFDALAEQSYDRSTERVTTRSWGGVKKKTTTTVRENNDVNATSVDIQAKNITIQNKDAIQNKDTKTSIDIHSAKLNANGGKISIRSAGDLNFLTVDELKSSKVDVTKKSSFAGVKYNKSSTNTTRTQVTELPAKLKADYIGTKSGFDTRLVGTEFEYLKDATIESGGKIELLGAKTNITETLKKEKNSVVWQSMQDQGSITETAQLPQFNGPTAPTFKAEGGLTVQVPVGEKDQNKIQLRDEIIKLSQQPGNEYLKTLVNRDDIDWQKVILTQQEWDYKSQGLTGAGAAIIVIIVTVVTTGAGTAGAGAALFGTTGATTTAVANAAVTSLASQASVSLINNGGDIGKTLKDLGTKDSVKNLTASIVTAGLMSQVGSALNLQPNSPVFSDRLLNNFATSVGSTLVQTAVKGGDLEGNLQLALLSGLAGALQGELAQNIKGLENVNYIAHKIAHAAAGCLAGAIQKSCEAGAIGAAVGEIIASYLNDGSKKLTDSEKAGVINKSKLIAGVIAAYAGYDVNISANSAEIAVENNNMEYVYEAELDDLWLTTNGDKDKYYEGVLKIAERDSLALDILTLGFGGGTYTYKSFLLTVEKLIEKGNIPITKDGLSAAARKLSSHAQREGGTFPKPSGSITQQNKFAEKILRDILEDPSTRIETLSRGGVEFRKPNGQGVRYNKDGSFSGFLDPKKER